MKFFDLKKVKRGDKVAIVSPSVAAPAIWPDVYEICLKRLKLHFDLDYIEYPSTSKLGASIEERSRDLIAAFEDEEVKAVFASLGGDDQVTYIKNLPKEPFKRNPKPFFGFSDNSHFINHLWQLGVPAYYGASLFTEFGIQGEMHPFTLKYIDIALFQKGKFEVEQSSSFNDIGLNWSDKKTHNQIRRYQENEGWYWSGEESVSGILWGGCLESIAEMLRHRIKLPSLEELSDIVLALETSEGIPDKDYVMRVLRALGELGILGKIKGLLMGRPKAWEFNNQKTDKEKIVYKKEQCEIVERIVRRYNANAPIVQNLDFGHTSPQIPLPFGRRVYLESEERKIFADF